MDLTQLSDEDLAVLANVGNIAAIAEQSRRIEDNTTKTMSPIERENLKEAINRNLITDRQGDILTFDMPPAEAAMPADDLDLDTQASRTDDVVDELLKQSQSGGIVDFFKTLGQGALSFITGIPFIGQGITSLANRLGDTFKGSRFYNPISPESGKRIFAPGARAGDAVNLGFRRDANRFANMLNRLSQGKKIGRSNLRQIMGPTRLNLPGVNVDEMAKSIQESSETGYGGFGSASAAAEAAAASGGRDYSSSPGAMAGDMEYGEE